jgi:dienelactone hydrolase
MKTVTLHVRLITLLMMALVVAGAGSTVASAQTPDPGATGPFAVTREEYDYGNLAFQPTGFPSAVELKASVHYPTGLPGGPFPVVVFMHGRHVTCYRNTTAALRWPCRSTESVIPSYQGYDYISQQLASNGYIVVSVSANGINAFDNNVTDLGMQARAELIQRHLNQWNTFNTAGAAPFGTKFVGKVDLTRVGTMGHSRGGEGVVKHYVHNTSLGSPYGVKAVFPLAPVDFNRPVVNNSALAVLLPYCDGDVSDNQGVHFYDDARYNVAGDTAPKHTLQVMGANHNFYNTVWTPGLFPAGTSDDWNAFVSGGTADAHCGTGAGNKRLTAAQQRGTGLAYISAAMRAYVGGETQFLPLLTGEAPPPASAQTTNLHVSYHAPGTAAKRRDVNRLLTSANLTTNTLGGATTQTGLTPHDLCGGNSPQPQHCLPSTQSTSRQPHTVPSARATTLRGLSQLRTGWSALATYTNDLPLGQRDVSGFQWLTFRASVNFADTRNPSGVSQNFKVILTDGAGATATLLANNYTAALFYPPGTTGPVPKVLLNTVRIPVSAFSGINLSDVRSVRFTFDQNLTGALLISDLAFSSAP